MRPSAILVLVLVALAGSAGAEPVRAPTCEAAASRVAQVVTAGDRLVTKLVVQRCTTDRWAPGVRGCFAAAATELGASSCLDQLSKDQSRLLAGDADRLDVKPTSKKLVQWLSRKPVAAFAPVPARRALFTLAVQTDAPPVARTRELHAEGMTAYRAGRYDVAVKKFQAAADADPSPELVYHLAQAYRLKGEHRMALELYEKYLELSPDGAAAGDSRRQIELLVEQQP